MIARDIMVASFAGLSPDQTVGDAIRLMEDQKALGLPVVTQGGALVGSLSWSDILKQVIPQYIVSGELHDVRFAPDLGQFHERVEALKQTRVATIMEIDPPTVSPSDSALECATLFLQIPARVMLVYVVEEARRVVGVIAPWDVIKGRRAGR